MNPSAMHLSPECQECGKRLVFTSKEWAVCPDGHGKLIPRKWIEHGLDQTQLSQVLEQELEDEDGME